MFSGVILALWVLLTSTGEPSPADTTLLIGRPLAPFGVEGPTAFLRSRDPRLLPGMLRVELTASPVRHSPLRGQLRPRSFELSRFQSSLKGVKAASTTALLLGAMSETFGWWDEDLNWWTVGGAAALGAIYGGTLGHDDSSWRIETRIVPDDE